MVKISTGTRCSQDIVNSTQILNLRFIGKSTLKLMEENPFSFMQTYVMVKTGLICTICGFTD